MKHVHSAATRRGRPPTGRAVPAAERMRRMRERRKAAGFRIQTRWVPAASDESHTAARSDHRLHDIRSLAMHAVIVRKIGRDPKLLAVAQTNMERWRKRFGSRPDRWWEEWNRLLQRPWREVADLITNPGELATQLRQSSPFAGVLTPTERQRIYDAFRT